MRAYDLSDIAKTRKKNDKKEIESLKEVLRIIDNQKDKESLSDTRYKPTILSTRDKLSRRLNKLSRRLNKLSRN